MICTRFPSSGLRPSVSAEAPPRQDAVTGCHPFHGFQLPFCSHEGFGATRLAALACYALAGRRLAMGMSPVSRALNAARLRSPTARQVLICRADRGYFQNVADVSIVYQIFGTHVVFSVPVGKCACGGSEGLVKCLHVQENSLCSAYAGGSGPGLGC